MRRIAAFLIALGSVAAAGCFDIEQTLTLDKNLAGTAGFSMQVNLEPIADFMATMKHSMTGGTGAPSAADIAQARKEILAGMSKSQSTDMEKEEKEFQDSLPAGVKLLDATMKEDGLKIVAGLQLGFDHPSKLSAIKLQKPDTAVAAGLPVENPMESPFGGLQVVDEGKTVLITSPARNPMGDKQAELGQMPMMDAAMKKQIDALVGTLRVAFKITAPFTVVEHNAHRKEGNTLVWDYNMAALQKMTPEQMAQGIRVRYRK